MAIALIDFDMLLYRCGFASEKKRWKVDGELYPVGASESKIKAHLVSKEVDPGKLAWEAVYEVEPVEFALGRTKMFIKDILHTVGTTAYKGFLGTENDTSLFRHGIAKTLPYKGNRKNFKKPAHYQNIREYLTEHYNTEVVLGIESDDAIAMYQSKYKDTISVHQDKDINQVPGKHFNPVTGDIYDVTKDEASRNFWRQVLTGDSTDNIPGLHRIGPKTADQILWRAESESDRYKAVKEAYRIYSKKEDWEAYLKEQASLIYLLRHEDDYWKEPV